MINPEQQLQENALKANFTEVQQMHFDKLMSELEVISGGLGFAELKEKDPIKNSDLSTIIEQVVQRDDEDRNRKIAPLKQAKDAVLIDTTNLSIDQVVKEIIKTINPSS